MPLCRLPALSWEERAIAVRLQFSLPCKWARSGWNSGSAPQCTQQCSCANVEGEVSCARKRANTVYYPTEQRGSRDQTVILAWVTMNP